MFYGIDTAAPLNDEQLDKLVQNGITFVGRYLVPRSLLNALTPAEIKRIHKHGLGIMLCWEMGSSDMKEGHAKGFQHGSRARELADEYGVPDGTAIYFACDYNAQEEDFLNIEAYLQAAKLALGDKYKIGLYGHGRIVDYIGNHNIIKHFWQCCAWSNNVVSRFANVFQYQWSGGAQAKELAVKTGIKAVDLDDCQYPDNAGFWNPKNQEPEPIENWYDIYMNWAKETGLMTDGRPNDPLTRAEAAAILYRLYGPEDRKDLSGIISDD